jgi:uncharacterized phiE125 gp8 family phage protein
MSAILLSAPAVEPLSLAEAKAFLRVEHADDDDVIAALIAASRIHIEAQTRRALVTQDWRIILDAWPVDGRLPIRPAPLRTLTAVRVYDASGVARAVDTESFVLDEGGSELAFAPWALAAPGRLAAGIELDVVVGYGDAATDVPEGLRENRLLDVSETRAGVATIVRRRCFGPEPIVAHGRLPRGEPPA